MAALATGIFNHAMAASQALSGSDVTSMSSPATAESGTGGTSSSSSTISSNDFLTLLVTEMKNQDPTTTTDPNEYINQLVNVNSLEQLISINQTLSTDLGSSNSASGSSSSARSAAAASGPAGSNDVDASAQTGAASPKGGVLTTAQAVSFGAGAEGDLSALASTVKRAPGNLSDPNAQPAAQMVAHALDGRSRLHSKASQ